MFFNPPKRQPIPEGQWQNWPETLKSTPARIVTPADNSALAETLTMAKGPIRIVGGNHSFTPVVQTDGALVSLDALTGVHDVDTEACTAWVRAGTRLRATSKGLAEHGLAFKNLGDIDVQSVVGATATASHGSGKRLPCIAAEIRAVRMMTADGEMMEIGPDAPELPAAQVALGALGAVTDVQLCVRKSLRLHRRTWMQELSQTLEEAHDRWDRHRNYEFFVLPFCDMAMSISHDETDAAPTVRSRNDDDASVMQMKLLRTLGGRTPGLRRRVMNTVARGTKTEETIDDSWKLLASDRNVPFTEMEYHLPVEAALEALREVLARIEAQRPDVFFPIEVRMTAGDDAWLSPFQGAARISIAVHAYFRDDHDWFYSLAEPIFRAAGGRPHWGKCHSLTARDLEEIYPDFNRFLALREKLDPKGRFVTPYFAKLWGLS